MFWLCDLWRADPSNIRLGEADLTGAEEDPPPGSKTFRSEWKLDSPASKLWKTLGDILALGGTFERVEVTKRKKIGYATQFEAPYVASKWPDDADPVDYCAVIGANVRVRLRPSNSATIIDTLSYDLLKTDTERPASPLEHPAWVKITTPSGHQGYVAGRYIRNTLDFEADFQKIRGRWYMTGLYQPEL